ARDGISARPQDGRADRRAGPRVRRGEPHARARGRAPGALRRDRAPDQPRLRRPRVRPARDRMRARLRGPAPRDQPVRSHRPRRRDLEPVVHRGDRRQHLLRDQRGAHAAGDPRQRPQRVVRPADRRDPLADRRQELGPAARHDRDEGRQRLRDARRHSPPGLQPQALDADGARERHAGAREAIRQRRAQAVPRRFRLTRLPCLRHGPRPAAIIGCPFLRAAAPANLTIPRRTFMPKAARFLLLATALAALHPAAAEPDYFGWDQYLGGPDSAQYSALTQITPENVAELEVVWEYPTGEGAPPQFNPIVVDGTMYVQTGSGQIAALDPATGRELWKSEATGRIGSRGINYWQSADGSDRRLVFLNEGLVRAIDARTGKYVPNFSIDLRDALPEGSIVPERPLMTSNPGRVFEDLFIVSLPGGQGYGSYPSNIQAYDIR